MQCIFKKPKKMGWIFVPYTGTKARFTTEEGTQIVSCFNHHIFEFIHAAKKTD